MTIENVASVVAAFAQFPEGHPVFAECPKEVLLHNLTELPKIVVSRHDICQQYADCHGISHAEAARRLADLFCDEGEGLRVGLPDGDPMWVLDYRHHRPGSEEGLNVVAIVAHYEECTIALSVVRFYHPEQDLMLGNPIMVRVGRDGASVINPDAMPDDLKDGILEVVPMIVQGVMTVVCLRSLTSHRLEPGRGEAVEVAGLPLDPATFQTLRYSPDRLH